MGTYRWRSKPAKENRPGRGLTTICPLGRETVFGLASATGKVLFPSPFALNFVIVTPCMNDRESISDLSIASKIDKIASDRCNQN